MASEDRFHAIPAPLGLGEITIAFVLLSQRVEISCERTSGGGVCLIYAERLVSRSEVRSVRIADLVRAKLEEDGDGDSRVTLETKDGDVPLTSAFVSELGSEKAAVVDEVNRYVVNPGAERVVAIYGSRGASPRRSRPSRSIRASAPEP